MPSSATRPQSQLGRSEVAASACVAPDADAGVLAGGRGTGCGTASVEAVSATGDSIETGSAGAASAEGSSVAAGPAGAASAAGDSIATGSAGAASAAGDSIATGSACRSLCGRSVRGWRFRCCRFGSGAVSGADAVAASGAGAGLFGALGWRSGVGLGELLRLGG